MVEHNENIEIVVAIAAGLIIYILIRIAKHCARSNMISTPDLYPSDFNRDIIASKKSVYQGPQGIMRGLPIKRKRLAAEFPLLGLNGRPREITRTLHSGDSTLRYNEHLNNTSVQENYSARFPPKEQKIDIYSGDYDEDYIESPQMLGEGTGPAGILRGGHIRRQPYYYGTGLGQVQVAKGGEHRNWPYTLDNNCSSVNIDLPY